MKIDDYFKVFVNNKIIANETRLPVCRSEEAAVKNKKYELVRYYKLRLRKEMLYLRDCLKEKGLILTEYIDYNNERYAIFRLDGKDLVVNQIKRNKELIENKKKEIRDFTNNVVKRIKKEKIRLTKKNKVARKKQYIKIKELRKEKFNSLYAKVSLLKSELKLLKSKTYEDLKREVDIFEGTSNMKAERIFVKIENKKKKEIDTDDFISTLRETMAEDERKLYKLHLFNKSSFRNFIEGTNNKIIFINSTDKVDVYTYKEDIDGVGLVDLVELDKKQGLYSSTILSLEARNFYNHYRSINNLEEIL